MQTPLGFSAGSAEPGEIPLNHVLECSQPGQRLWRVQLCLSNSVFCAAKLM
jgi:hypothetical protein